MVAALFWFLVFIVFYVYFGYPALLVVMGKLKRQRQVSFQNITPSVSLIIAAHNEEKVIGQKLENALSLEYPRDKLEIVVASDGSSDRTNEVVTGFRERGVRLVREGIQRGKASIQNKAVREARGEILLFSDANAMWQRHTLQKILPHFSDEKVGCVVGKLSYVNEKATETSKNEGLYWRYELFLRQQESELGNLALASGPIMAVRKQLFAPLDEAVSEDFVLPMQAAIKGYKVIYEPDAISEELLYQSNPRDMFKAKVRIILPDVRGLFLCRAILNPLKYPLYSWGLISHKLLRWLVPYFLLAIFVLNLFLVREGWLYLGLLLAQTAFYSLAGLGALLTRKGGAGLPFRVPYGFCLVNLASLVALGRVLQGDTAARWKPVR